QRGADAATRRSGARARRLVHAAGMGRRRQQSARERGSRVMMPLLACRRDGRPSFALLGQRLGAPTRIMRLQLRTFLVVAAVLALGVPAAARASSSDNVI